MIGAGWDDFKFQVSGFKFQVGADLCVCPFSDSESNSAPGTSGPGILHCLSKKIRRKVVRRKINSGCPDDESRPCLESVNGKLDTGRHRGLPLRSILKCGNGYNALYPYMEPGTRADTQVCPYMEPGTLILELPFIPPNNTPLSD